MRVVKEIIQPPCRITIYAWNNRYLIKLEEGMYEQTFKVDQSDFAGDDDVLRIVDAEFIQQALARFSQMAHALDDAISRTEP